MQVRTGGTGHWHGPVTRLGLLGPAQLCRLARSSPVTWAGRGPTRKKWNLLRNFFKKKYVMFWNYVYCILDQYGLFFFYIVKIQIWYENTRFLSRYQKNKKYFVFMHKANTLTFFLRLLSKKQIFEVSKMCFRMDFLNTTKIIFLAFLDFTTCL